MSDNLLNRAKINFSQKGFSGIPYMYKNFKSGLLISFKKMWKVSVRYKKQLFERTFLKNHSYDT